MASLKYRCLTPNVQVEEHAVAASQKFYHEGGAFCYLDSSGHVTVAVTATTTLYGWVLVPQGQGLSGDDSYWQSSATAGASKVQVIVDEDARFLAPLDDDITIANLGDALDVVLTTADGSQQLLDVGTTDNDVARIVGLGTSLKGGTVSDAIVKIHTWQADT
jgi:hypothetical protein